MEDRDLFQQIKRSNLQSFERLMDKYMNYLYGIINRVGSNRLQEEDKEEVIANVWIKIWNKREALEIEEGKEKIYIGVMCRNETISYMRKKGLVEEIPLDEDQVIRTSEDREVEYQIVQEEEKRIIKEVVDSLPEPDREIFIRRYFYFEKVKDIAEAMGINSKTIATKLFRGRDKLAQLLSERGIKG